MKAASVQKDEILATIKSRKEATATSWIRIRRVGSEPPGIEKSVRCWARDLPRLCPPRQVPRCY